MPNFWSRRKERKGGLPQLPAPGRADFGIPSREQGPEFRLDDATPRQPEVDDPEFSVLCQHRRPGKGRWLSSVRRWLWLFRGSGGGFRKSCGAMGTQAPVGSVPGCARWEGSTVERREFQRREFQQEKPDTRSSIQPLGWGEPSVGCKARAGGVPRCARMEEQAPEKLEKPRTGQNSRGEKAQQEKLDVCSAIQPLKDSWAEPSVGCRAQAGAVPREGGGHGNGVDQTRLPLQAGASEDEEGQSSHSPQILELPVEDRDTPTIPGKDLEPPPAEGTSREEPRHRVWEKLERLGEPMERWEGKPLGTMAARLAELILQTHTHSYPTEQGAASRPCSGQPGAGIVAQRDVGVSVPGIEPRVPLGMRGDVGSGRGGEGSREDGQPRPLPEPVCMFVVHAESRWRTEFPVVWARYRMDCGKVAEEVDLDGPPVPFQRQRPLPPDARNAVEELLPEFLEEGIVVEGTSSSNNPLLPTWEGSKWRLNLDCKALNAATPTEPQESLGKNRILTSIPAGSSYFSVLDLSCASFAIPLARSCWPRFAFTFQGRQFLFTRLPSGYQSTNSIVHRRVARMLSRLEQGDRPWAFNHVDDILIVGRTPEEAAARTRRVLRLIQDTGFKAKFEKAQLVQPRVKYLGIAIGAGGREVPDSVLEELRHAPRPCNARQLRSLLGKFGCWRDHIPDYWELALPFQRLTKDWVRWEWGQEQQQQLRELKEAQVCVLRFPDKSQPFLIRMRIHPETAGATLLQDEGGALVPVRHISRILRGQDSLSLEEKQCVAAAWAVREFQPFTGLAPILLQLPDSPGKFLSHGQALGPRGPRLPEQWTLLLVPERAPGQKCSFMELPTAPPLRCLPPGAGSHAWFLASCRRGSSVGFAATNLEERWLLGASGGGSELDAELGALWELLERHRSPFPLYLYSSCESLWEWLGWRRFSGEEGWNSRATWKSIRRWLYENPGQLQLGWGWVHGSEEDPRERDWLGRAGARAEAAAGGAEISWKNWEPSKYERQEIVSQCHRWHEGAEETLARVREVAWWEGARRDVERWVRECPGCGSGGAGPQRAEGPWSRLSVGLATGLPETPEGFRALLVVRDEASGWVEVPGWAEAFPLREVSDWVEMPGWAEAFPLREVSGWVEAFPLREARAEGVPLLRDLLGRLGKVRSVWVPKKPSWLGDALSAAPLREYWHSLERGRGCPAALALGRVAQKVGKGWAKMLPLLLAAARAGSARAELEPLLCVPGLALEALWEERRARDAGNNELARLAGMRVLPGYRDAVQAALGGRPRRDPAEDRP